jgi:ABC-type ATPase involved in cell division
VRPVSAAGDGQDHESLAGEVTAGGTGPEPRSPGEVVLELRHAAKSFGAVRALIDGSVELRAGEVHALLGENGAGKSTLVKILAGVHQPDSGALTVAGRQVTLHGPAAARAAGIAVIYQEPTLFPDLTVASATNQNPWIGYMKQELKKYPKMSLASVVYGNDDPTASTQVTQGLLQQYPNLKGIISPTTVGIAAAAAVLDTPKYRGKIALTGLGTPDEMKKFVADGTVKSFELWNPADLGYLAAYAAVEMASGKVTGASGQSFPAGKLGNYTVGADNTVLLGPPFVFDASNINKFNF